MAKETNPKQNFTENFKKVIQWHLTRMATKDALFAPNLVKKGKNIDDCCTYIINTVKATGQCGFSDDEIYSMAIHYFQEDNIEVGGKPANCRIVVNHTIELTEEEKEKARQDAIKSAQQEAYKKVTTKRITAKTDKKTVDNQISLF